MRLTLKNKDWTCQLTTPMYEKLHDLEDIEEELGVDLVTLFKALSGCVWFKICDYHPTLDKHPEIKSSFPNVACLDVGVTSVCSFKRKVIILDFGDLVFEYKFADYGKTWALTKEELEH